MKLELISLFLVSETPIPNTPPEPSGSVLRSST
jgi:hypothetical protein